MSFSISASTAFYNIDWNSFKNRPPINESMPACSQVNWEYDIPCCTDGYVISDTLQLASENNKLKTPEGRFLSKYPCVNSIEFEKIVDNLFAASSAFIGITEPPQKPISKND
jgi:hypothetical protein